ncbi:MAG: flagellar motor switch phosphatase FliY, partial [Acetanaerobacterium sp.]
ATAVSTLLNKKVLITTPEVQVSKVQDIEYAPLEPAMCVEITYIQGITGSNVMILKQSDIKLILDQLMGLEPTPDEDFVFDEISISAACEVMNQMMGSSATALSSFLGRAINISTPVAYILDTDDIKKHISDNEEEQVVVINFELIIEGITQSKFMSIMQMPLAKEIITQSQQLNDMPDEAAPVEELPERSQPTEDLLKKVYDAPNFDESSGPVSHVTPPAPQPGPPMQQGYAPQQQQPVYAQPAGFYAQPQYAPPQYPQYQQPSNGYEPSNVVKQSVDVHGVDFQNFSNLGQPLPEGQHTNLDLIMQVPLQVTVEIGKTKKKIKDILEFSQGMVIELEKQAGAPVDVIVNGQLVAKGDVVVVEDNFGVRITEILKNTDFLNGIS